MTYVTLLPRSNTNPSNMHVVIDVETWQDALNRGAAVNPIASYHTFRDAEEVKDRLNREVARAEKLQAMADAITSGEWQPGHQGEPVPASALLDGHAAWDRQLRG